MNSIARPAVFQTGVVSRRGPLYFATQQFAPEPAMSILPRRSVLYMPGNSARAIEKARSLPVDALIFDLEDAVAPEMKDAARGQLAAALREGGFGRRELVIRINALDTQWANDDIDMVARVAPAAMLVPKISTPGDIMKVAREMREAGVPESTRLWAMMETPLAVLNAGNIASTGADPASRLSVLVMGVNDLARETRARLTPGRPGMLPWLAMCVAAARAHGVEILDGVYGDIGDAEGFRAECEQARDMGMDGKTLIHPSQIAACNEVFSPAPSEIAWARKVIAAFELPENAGKGAISLDGRMIERLHADIARRTLALAGSIGDIAG